MDEWQERTVLLYEVLHTIMGTSGSSSLAKDVKKEESMAVAGAVLLHQRNDHMSAVQHALGLVLDFGGATDKTISVLANVGVSSAPRTILTLKNDL